MKINLSSDQKKLFKFVADGQEFEFFRSLGTIYSNSERSEEFLKRNAFLTYSGRFLRSDRFKFKWKKIIWIEKHAEKV